jgi:hypothetical protein
LKLDILKTVIGAGYEGGELLSLEEEISHMSRENRRLEPHNNNNNRLTAPHQDMSTEVNIT